MTRNAHGPIQGTTLVAWLVITACACQREASPPAATPASALVGPRASEVVVTPMAAPAVPVVVVAPPAAFPAAPQVSGHGTGGTCESACGVERQSYLRTMCGNDHGSFREMDRECRADAQRAYRECVSRCQR